MFKLSKRGEILALILALSVSLYLLFISQAAKEQERKKRIFLENELVRLKKAGGMLVLEMDKVKKENAISFSRQEELKKESELFKAKLRMQRKDKELVVRRLEACFRELSPLKAELEKRIRNNGKLLNNLEELQSGYHKLQLQLREAHSAKQELEKKITTLTSRASAREKIAGKKKIAEAEDTIFGEVLVVNREFNFIVINLGSKHELDIGDELVVFRGNENLGKAFVEMVYDVASTATFPSFKENIRKGDKVKLKAN